jgi:hypothetical protein
MRSLEESRYNFKRLLSVASRADPSQERDGKLQ